MQEIIDAVRSGARRVEDIVRAGLAKASAQQSELGAWIYLDTEGALAQARQLDQLFAAGAPLPPLAGVTAGVKDLFALQGMPCRAGSSLTSAQPAAHDAALVARLREAGVVFLGATSMPEFALGITPGARNPHDVRHTPGSSSSGSAIAVAAGHVPLAVATQTNASIIRPAAFCGVAAFKPTQGRLPTQGMTPLVPSLDQPGFMAKEVSDISLLYDILCPVRLEDVAEPAAPSDGKPFALVRTPLWEQATEATRNALEMLATRLGAQELLLPQELHSVWQWLDCIMYKELADNLAAYQAREHELTAPVQRAVQQGRGYSHAAYEDALAGQKALKAWGAENLASYAAVITPAAPGPAPLLEQGAGSPVFSTIWSLMGAPSLTLPLVKEQGLPVGVQLVAAPNFDRQLLATAYDIFRTPVF